MKVVQINSVCGVGSTGRIATDLHKAYTEAGYESHIAYGRGNAINCEETIKIGNTIDIYKHVLLTRTLDYHGLGSVKATTDFIKKLKKLDPDAIHLHNIHGYYLNYEILFQYLKRAGKKVIWTLHDCWAFTGHCAHFEYAGCDCWRPGGEHHCIQKKSYPTSWLWNNSKGNYSRKKQAFTGVDDLTIVTPSKWLAKLVGQSFLQGYPIKIINNGINTDVFKPKVSTFKEKHSIQEKFMLLGVANIWNEKKGLQYFIALSKLLKTDEVIVLVGLSDKQSKLLPDNIIGISRTDSIVELAEIYSAADVFINPTLEDNFPTVNLESLASGTPVITFDTGGSPEAIDEKTGIVTEEKSSKSIYDAIKKIRKGLYSVEMCRKKSLTYSVKSMNKDYLQLYKDL